MRESKASTNEILELFDERKTSALNILESATDENLNSLHTMKRGENILFSLPRKVNIRNFAFNHLYHHRGQLSIFLRLLDLNVPGMYGPSANEL